MAESAETIEKRKARQRAYYQAHKEQILAYAKEWRRRNPERTRENKRKWYERRKHDGIPYHVLYYQAHKEKMREYAKAWRDKHRERYRMLQKKYAKRRKERLASESAKKKNLDIAKVAAMFKSKEAAGHFMWIVNKNKKKEVVQ